MKKMTTATDDEILSTFRKNPDEGFALLMQAYSEPVYWNIRRMVVGHEDAQDVAQETFVRIYSALHDFKGKSQLKTWIYRIATNEALRFLQSRRQETLSDEQQQADLLARLQDSEYVNYDEVLTIRFQQAVLQLPEKQRVVFNLRYYDELDYQSIHEITGENVSTLKSNYHWAKEKIKQYMLS